MIRKTPHQEESSFAVKVPTEISFKDVLIGIGVLVSVITTWGLTTTRVSLLEQKVQVISEQIVDIKQQSKQDHARLQEIELMVTRLVQELQRRR